MHHRRYIHRSFQIEHGSWEPGCNKCRVNDTDSQNIPWAWGPLIVTIIVELIKARSNKYTFVTSYSTLSLCMVSLEHTPHTVHTCTHTHTHTHTHAHTHTHTHTYYTHAHTLSSATWSTGGVATVVCSPGEWWVGGILTAAFSTVVVEDTELVTGEPGVAWEWGDPVTFTAKSGEFTPTRCDKLLSQD